MPEGTAAVATPAITGRFVADKAHSTLRFTVRHMLVARYSATFDDFDVEVEADESGARVEGSVQVESISITHPPEFREHVVYGSDFFDAANHPRITFASQQVRDNGDGTLALEGRLTVKGISRPFAAVGSYQPLVEDPWGGARTAVEFSTTVDRRDWDMNWQAPLPKGGNVLSWDVQIDAHLELIRQD